jgi:hypothetical protein
LVLVGTARLQVLHLAAPQAMTLYLAPLRQPEAVVEQVVHHPLLRVVEMVALVVAERMPQARLRRVLETLHLLVRPKVTMAAQGQAALLSEERVAAALLPLAPMAALVPVMVEMEPHLLFLDRLSPTQAAAVAALIFLRLAPEERAAAATVALATPIPG